MPEEAKPWCVIGYIDAYDAIHYQPITHESKFQMHSYYWPNQTHKTWRFNLHEWQLDNSILSKDKLTKEEVGRIYELMRKKFQPPIWILEGEIWDKLGRPSTGKKYALYEKKCIALRNKLGIPLVKV